MPSEHPNIVFIYCDELRTDALGCYGHPTIRPHTPTLDRLAESGVLFENNYCNSPICVPSRTSMLTGTYCEQTSVYANEGAWSGFKMGADLVTWPEAFARAGYATANFGKVHVPSEISCWQHNDGRFAGISDLKKHIPPNDPSILSPGGTAMTLGGDFPDEVTPYPPEQTTQHALDWMAAQNGPYVARLSLLQPHTPVYPPSWAVKMYIDSPGLAETFDATPGVSAFEKCFAEVVGADNFTPPQIRMARVYYYALVTWIDSQVARVLDFLESRGQCERTLIVFEADHGAALGEGGRYAKHVFSPEVHRVPRIIAWPEHLPVGQRRADICESLDLARTMTGLCGVELNEREEKQFRGRNLFVDPEPEAVYSTIGFGLAESQAFPNLHSGNWSEGVGWPRRVCVRTRQFRLDRNTRFNNQSAKPDQYDTFLADTLYDPFERTNLAGDPRYAGVQARLGELLDTHVADSLAPAAMPG